MSTKNKWIFIVTTAIMASGAYYLYRILELTTAEVETMNKNTVALHTYSHNRDSLVRAHNHAQDSIYNAYAQKIDKIAKSGKMDAAKRVDTINALGRERNAKLDSVGNDLEHALAQEVRKVKTVFATQDSIVRAKTRPIIPQKILRGLTR